LDRKFRGIVIYDPAAAAAYKMGMRLHPAVEPLLPLNNPDGYYQTFLPEKIDVPVHCGQRKTRDIRF
jgi:hypothetical protein